MNMGGGARPGQGYGAMQQQQPFGITSPPMGIMNAPNYNYQMGMGGGMQQSSVMGMGMGMMSPPMGGQQQGMGAVRPMNTGMGYGTTNPFALAPAPVTTTNPFGSIRATTTPFGTNFTTTAGAAPRPNFAAGMNGISTMAIQTGSSSVFPTANNNNQPSAQAMTNPFAQQQQQQKPMGAAFQGFPAFGQARI